MKWAYTKSGGFIPLPASPLLLPAVLIWGTLSLIGVGKGSRINIPLETIPDRKLAEYRRRYIYLKTIESVRPLTFSEERQLYEAQHPCGDQYPPLQYLEGVNAEVARPPMAQQGNESGTGWGAFLVVFALVLVITFWQWALPAGLTVWVIYTLRNAMLKQEHFYLKALVTAADRRARLKTCRVSLDPIRVRERFGIVQAITLVDTQQLPSRIIDVQCLLIDRGDSHLFHQISISLSPPLEPKLLRSTTGFANWQEQWDRITRRPLGGSQGHKGCHGAPGSLLTDTSLVRPSDNRGHQRLLTQ